jgi:hypothetical protein
MGGFGEGDHSELAERIPGFGEGVTTDDLVSYVFSAGGYTTVGRWMSTGELEQMLKEGVVQESRTGTTHVAWPADPDSFGRQARPGSVYVEFDVPESSVQPTGGNGWAMIKGPNSIHGRLAKRKGLPIPQMPEVRNIRVKDVK